MARRTTSSLGAMFRAAFTFAVFALAASVLAYATTHGSFPRVGSEGALFFGGTLLWLSALSVVLTWAVCLALFVRRQRSQLAWPLACSAIALAVLLIGSGILR